MPELKKRLTSRDVREKFMNVYIFSTAFIPFLCCFCYCQMSSISYSVLLPFENVLHASERGGKIYEYPYFHSCDIGNANIDAKYKMRIDFVWLRRILRIR